MIGIGINIARAGGRRRLDRRRLARRDRSPAATPATVLARVAPALSAALRSLRARRLRRLRRPLRRARPAARPRRRRRRPRRRARASPPASATDGALLRRHRRRHRSPIASGEVSVRLDPRPRRRAHHAEGAARGCCSSPTCSSSPSPAAALDGILGLQSHGDREPERLANQVRPQTIRAAADGAAASAAAPSGVRAARRRRFAAARSGRGRSGARGSLPAGQLDRQPRRAHRRRDDRRSTHTYRVGNADAALTAARLATLRLDAAGRGFSRLRPATESAALSARARALAPSARRGQREHRARAGAAASRRRARRRRPPTRLRRRRRRRRHGAPRRRPPRASAVETKPLLSVVVSWIDERAGGRRRDGDGVGVVRAGDRRAGRAGVEDRPVVAGDALAGSRAIEVDVSATAWPAVGVVVVSEMLRLHAGRRQAPRRCASSMPAPQVDGGAVALELVDAGGWRDAGAACRPLPPLVGNGRAVACSLALHLRRRQRRA